VKLETFLLGGADKRIAEDVWNKQGR